MFSRYLNFCVHFLTCKKKAWRERQGWPQNVWRHNLFNKQLQDIYWLISQEVKTIRQWDSAS